MENKTRDQIIAEREAKKRAKKMAKSKNSSTEATATVEKLEKPLEMPKPGKLPNDNQIEKDKNSRDGIQKPEVQKQPNQLNKEAKQEIVKENLSVENSGKTKAQLKAERRAKQESQRAAKEGSRNVLTPNDNKPIIIRIIKPIEVQKEKPVIKLRHQRVKMFSHLNFELTPPVAHINLNIHAAIVQLGAKYSSRVISGSNARCVAFLHALKKVVFDYVTPAEKEFSRGLESCLGNSIAYLNSCRPSSVSMTNALKHIKSHLTQMPNEISDEEAKRKLCDVIDTFLREQIDVAGEAISLAVQKKISNGDVILIYACSSLLFRILKESYREGKVFKVIVVDSSPWFEGREMLRRLVSLGIDCTYVLVSALSFIMGKITKVLLGAHALLANGYVMSRTGSSMVALMAKSYNVPVLVCCETYKFCERVQTDVFVYNDLGVPEDQIATDKRLKVWQTNQSLTLLSFFYDITPPDLVTAVVTEIAILPCTSVPVILRIKPSDMIS